MLRFVVFLSLVICMTTEAFSIRAKLPAYVNRCSKSDPGFEQCYIKNANKAIPFLVNGNARYNIPNMKPLKIDEIVVRNDTKLRFVLRNVKVYGLENSQLTGVNWNFNLKKFEQNLTNPRLTILGDYEMDGNIVDAPVQGIGKANITILNGRYTQRARYYIDLNNNGKLYDSSVKYKSQRIIYNLPNLYRGNEFIGYQTNIFVNNNWQEVSRILQPGAAKAMNESIVKVLQNVALIVPLDDIFLP